MPSPTSASFWSQIAPGLSKPQLQVEVRVEGHDDSKFYTSGSTVAGCVTIVSQQDIPLEGVKISLTGISTTNMVVYYNDITQCQHIFLELIMPDSQRDTPTLAAGQSYRFPFVFIIPHQLTPASCRYSSETEVHQRHLQLPPTVGSWQYNEQAPHAARIQYAVRAKVMTKPKGSDKEESTEVSHPLKILPLSLKSASSGLRLGDLERELATQVKSVRETRFSPYIGYLKATIRKPNPLVLSVSDLTLSGISTALDLEFVSSEENIRPPNIRVKSAAIQAVTHHSRSHINYLPGQQKLPDIPGVTAMPHFASTDLVIESKGRLLWKQGLIGSRTNSWDTSSDTTNATDADSLTSASVDTLRRTSTKHSAALTLAASVAPSTKKIFLPSFDTCLVSRTYVVRVTLVVGASGTTLSLVSPLEVVAESDRNAQPPRYVSAQGYTILRS